MDNDLKTPKNETVDSQDGGIHGTYGIRLTKKTYTVTYDANHGTGNVTSQTFEHGSGVTIKGAHGLSRTGYSFSTWKSGSTTYAPGTEYKKNSNLNLKAQWSKITYNISYTLNGGSDPANPATYDVETATFTLNNPTRTGYTFTGWTGTGLAEASTSVSIAKRFYRG